MTRRTKTAAPGAGDGGEGFVRGAAARDSFNNSPPFGGEKSAARMAALFQGLDRARGVFVPGNAQDDCKVLGKVRTVRQGVTLEHWRRHLAGEEGLGIPPLRDDGTVMFAAIDVDDYDLDHFQLARTIKERGFPLVLCKSKSGGAHLYTFFKQPAPAAVVRAQLREYANTLDYPNSEVFPKQDSLQEDRVGNWINMPYFGLEKRRAVDPDTGELNLEEFLALAEASAVDPGQLPAATPTYAQGQRHNELTSVAGKLRRAGLNGGALAAALRGVNEDICSPPLPSDEVRLIAEWASAKPTAAEDDSFENIEPLDIFGEDEKAAPEWDRKWFPRLIADAAEYVSDRTGADPIIPAVTGLAALCAVTKDQICFLPKKYDGWKQHPRLWLGIVGKPSIRKSPAMKPMIDPLHTLQGIYFDLWQSDLKEYERKKKNLKEGDPELEKPTLRSLLVQDTTVEALADTLNDNEGGVLAFHDELSGWFGAHDAYRASGVSKDRAFWLTAYDGGPYRVDRVNRGKAFIRNLSVALIGGIQPDPMRRIARNLTDDGLIQRFLFVVPRDAGRDKDTPHDFESLARYSDRLGEIASLDCESIKINCDDAAREILTDARHKLQDLSKLPVFGERQQTWLAKGPGHLARLCLLFHVCQHGDHDLMNSATVQMARDAYFELFLPSGTVLYRHVLGRGERHDEAVWVAGHILAHGLDTVSARDIARAYRELRPAKGEDYDDVRQVMEVLELAGWVAPVQGHAYRPPTRWNVNPAVHVRFAVRAVVEKDRRRRIVDEIRKKLSNDRATP